jgi:5-methylcytosine-specific restriction endonuclease McrA
MILTKKIFDSAASNRGGYTVKQLAALGEKRTAGWKDRIIGRDFSESIIIEFISGRRTALKKDRQKAKKKPRKQFTEYQKKFARVNGNPSYKKQLKYVNWKIVRLFILRRDNYTCTKCGAKENLHIHHTKYVGKFAWDTPPKYLKTLCEDCHKLVHNPDLLDEIVEKRFNKQNNNTKNAH